MRLLQSGSLLQKLISGEPDALYFCWVCSTLLPQAWSTNIAGFAWLARTCQIVVSNLVQSKSANSNLCRFKDFNYEQTSCKPFVSLLFWCLVVLMPCCSDALLFWCIVVLMPWSLHFNYCFILHPVRGSQNGEIHSGVCIESKDEHLGFFQCQARWVCPYIMGCHMVGIQDRLIEISFLTVSDQLDGFMGLLLPCSSDVPWGEPSNGGWSSPRNGEIRKEHLDLFISSHLDRVQPGSTARLIVWKPLPEPGLHLDHLELKISQDNSSSQVHENTHYRTSIAEDCRIRTEHLRMTSFGLPKTWLLLHHIRLLLHSFQHCKFAGLSCIHAEVSGICLASKWLASLTYTLMKDIHSWNLTISKQFWLQESSWILPCQSCSSNGLTRCANGTTMPFQSRSTAKWLGLMLGSLQ